MTIEPWLPPALLSFVLWGISVFLPKLAVRTLPPLHLTVYSSGFFMMAAVAILAFHGFDLDYDPKGIALSIAIGILGSLGQMLYLFSIRHSQMTYGVVITSLYPVIATALSFFLLDEKLTTRQWAGVALGICSVILMVAAHDAKIEE